MASSISFSYLLRPQRRTRASRASIAMRESGRLIIGEGKEGERGGKRSVDRLIQSNLGGREGTVNAGDKEALAFQREATDFFSKPSNDNSAKK